ncbi:MAG: DNA-processing protein DprA [Chloroflexota bacterium]
MSNHNEAAYWLALINNSGLKLSQLKPIAQQWHLMEGKSIAQIFNVPPKELVDRFALSEDEAHRLRKAADSQPAQMKQLEQWHQAGIELLTLGHPHYPTKLIYALPPKQQPLFLWAKGATQHLAEPTITILGSETPDPEVIEFVDSLVTLLASENMSVVSGYGKGLDRIAFDTMLGSEDGRGIAVLPMGLTAFSQITTKLDTVITAEKCLLISPFAPDVAYSERFAEARNVLVDSLALALLVPQADETTAPRAKAALERGLPVLVGMTDSPANRDLIDRGAFLMTDPGEVVDMVQQALIDDTLQAQIAQAPATETAPPPPLKEESVSVLDEDDDYALGNEVIDPLAADEALDILSSMGSVPDTLRARLMAAEAQRKHDE